MIERIDPPEPPKTVTEILEQNRMILEMNARLLAALSQPALYCVSDDSEIPAHEGRAK